MSVAVQASASTAAVRAAEAAALLYEQHSERIFAFCARRLRSREEAEDAVQQTFLKAFAAMRGGFRPNVERAWLYRIAENVCADRLRANGRRVRHETKDGDAQLAVLPARDSQPIDGLDQALAALTHQQRQALLLREWQGLSYSEIASELRLSESAVETLLFRARRSLAQKLQALPMIPWLKSTLLGGGAGAKAAAAVAVTVTIGIGGVSVAPLVLDKSPGERAPASTHERNAATPPAARERQRESRTRVAATSTRSATKRTTTPDRSAGPVVDTPVGVAQERPPAASAPQHSLAPPQPARPAPPVEQTPTVPLPTLPVTTPAPELTAPALPEAPVQLPQLERPKVELPSVELPPVELPPPVEPLEPLVNATSSDLPALP